LYFILLGGQNLNFLILRGLKLLLSQIDFNVRLVYTKEMSNTSCGPLSYMFIID